MEGTQQQISVAEIATAIGTENLVLRLVQLQRQVAELEAALAALQSQVQQAGVWGDEHHEHHEVRPQIIQRLDAEQQALRNGR